MNVADILAEGTSSLHSRGSGGVSPQSSREIDPILIVSKSVSEKSELGMICCHDILCQMLTKHNYQANLPYDSLQYCLTHFYMVMASEWSILGQSRDFSDTL
jgi:hypothetical protein